MIYYDGIGAVSATFWRDDDIRDGEVAQLTDNATAASCAAGDAFHGVLESYENDRCCMQLRGCVRVSYTGETAPTVGWKKLSADGQGGVQVDTTNGREYLVLSVDADDGTVSLLL